MRSALYLSLLAVATAGLAEEPPRSPRSVSYVIDVRLDPAARMLSGRQRLTWTNRSGRATDELWFHLYWNAWRNNRSSWMLEDRIRGRSDRGDEIERDDWGWIEVAALRLAGDGGAAVELPTRFESPDDGNPDDRTVLVARLPQAVAPGETVVVDGEWTARVPRTFARTGFRGDFYFIAHWFPKLGVFEADGWNCHQYHAATEYYSDYGVYDVAMTVPSGWVLGATGREVERRDNGDGTTTHRYRQEDVHAFTWTTSPDYLVARGALRGAGPAGGRHAAAAAAGASPPGRAPLRRHPRTPSSSTAAGTGPIPYGHLTVVDPAWGSGAGGMEYPTLFTCGTRLFNPFGGGSPESVTIHEAGHQFWYGLVGNNEFEHAWIDEGLNTFSTLRVQLERYGPSFWVKRYFRPPGTDESGFLPVAFRGIPVDPWLDRLRRYRPDATADVAASPTWRYYPASAANITYSKTALWLVTLERWLGWETLRGILSTFFHRWQFRHPTPEDLFAIAGEVAGRDLSGFFAQVFYDSAAFDYEVSSVASFPAAVEGWVEEGGGLAYREPLGKAARAARAGVLYRSEVVVRRNGDGVFPVEVVLGFDDGTEVRQSWDGRDRWRLFVEERAARLAWAEVDPDRVLALDLYPSNNSRRVEPRAVAPAVKWASKWLVWFQDHLLGFGFYA